MMKAIVQIFHFRSGSGMRVALPYAEATNAAPTFGRPWQPGPCRELRRSPPTIVRLARDRVMTESCPMRHEPEG